MRGGEAEIVRCLQSGLMNRQFGERLFIAPITVKNYVYGIYAKTLVSTRGELVNLLLSREYSRGSRSVEPRPNL